MNKICKITLYTACFLTVATFCKRATGEFDPATLQPPGAQSSKWNLSTAENPFDVNSLLSSQTFHYLGKGHQAFAFVSDDNQYVLKLFKPHYPKLSLFHKEFRFTWIPLATWVYRQVAAHSFEKRTSQDFTSYINALHDFKEQSELEYLHLAETSHLQSKIKLFNKIKVFQELDADKTCFLVQKRVDPFYKTLGNLIQENRKEEAKTLLSNFADLLKTRIDLGYFKPTHKFHDNFGCIGLKPVQLDVGRLLTYQDLGKDPSEAPTYSILQKSTIHLTHWLEKRDPSLAIFWSDAIESLQKVKPPLQNL